MASISCSSPRGSRESAAGEIREKVGRSTAWAPRWVRWLGGKLMIANYSREESRRRERLGRRWVVQRHWPPRGSAARRKLLKTELNSRERCGRKGAAHLSSLGLQIGSGATPLTRRRRGGESAACGTRPARGPAIVGGSSCPVRRRSSSAWASRSRAGSSSWPADSPAGRVGGVASGDKSGSGGGGQGGERHVAQGREGLAQRRGPGPAGQGGVQGDGRLPQAQG